MKIIRKKRQMVALVLCAILGFFGVHRFYVGKTKSGIVWLCTMGLFGFGWFFDIILIASGSFTDGNGNRLDLDLPKKQSTKASEVYLPMETVAEYGVSGVQAEQIHAATQALSRANEYAQKANQAITIHEFIENYDGAIKEIQFLMSFPTVPFDPPPAKDYEKLLRQYQEHLAEAILREKDEVQQKIDGEYSGNKEFQIFAITEFERSIERNKEKMATETRHFAETCVCELKKQVGVPCKEPKRTDLNSKLLGIDTMEGHDFEQWCAEALQNSGFTNVSVTPGSGDQGVDVLAEKDGIKYAIQCKRYSSDLGNTPVQEVYLGKAFYKCHVGVVLTNQHFTAGAKEAASASGVLLWDREWIKSYLSKHEGTEHDAQEVVHGIYKDALLPIAVDLVFETGIASVSMTQRRLDVGYARAARIVDEMEELGIVGEFRGSKPREILITKSQWESMRK